MGLSHFEDTASDGVTSWEEGGRELPTETSFTESVCSQQPEAQEMIEPPPRHPTSQVLDLTWPSALAVANLFPSGENRTQLTKRPWSCRKRDGYPGTGSSGKLSTSSEAHDHHACECQSTGALQARQEP